MSEEEYFALCLYTMWEPVRTDYTPMKIVTRKPKKLEDGMNYIIVYKKYISVVFHSYKTSKTYGDVTRRMPKDLERVTRQWLLTHPGTYLFQDEDGKPWTEQRLGATVRRPFQRIHDMDTGISMIRHAYATYMNRGAPPLQQMTKTANRMMHSVTTNHAYRFLEE